MDVLYFYKNTPDDFELRYSLRSLEKHAPWVRKVWLYGDRPRFLTDDLAVAEHVPDDHAAAILQLRKPVENFFLMLFLSSLIPEMTSEYVWCSDDHFLLRDYSIDDARKVRFLEDLRGKSRGPRPPGAWIDQVLRTCENLERLGYPAYNFETHTPIYFTKRRVLNAFGELRDFASEDRWFGFTGASAILNHACKHEGMAVHDISRERSRVGWWGPTKLTYGEMVRETVGKTFLFLSDGLLNDVTRRFLMERFPSPSRFEGRGAVESGEVAA